MSKHERTELELHVIDHFSNNGEWQDLPLDEEEHCLQEFYDAYKENKDAYASTPEEIELIDECIRIIGEDIEGTDYTAENCKTVIEALEKFGL
jgi:acyl-CoA reductase-like NAD-dependent aldehyde dehydrogenase